LRVGEVPVVLAAGSRVPVKPTPLTEADWRLLVREVAPSELAPRLDRQQACQFTYGTFVFVISFEAGVPSCDVRPAAAEVELAAPPSAEGDGLDIDLPPRAVAPVGARLPSAPSSDEALAEGMELDFDAADGPRDARVAAIGPDPSAGFAGAPFGSAALGPAAPGPAALGPAVLGPAAFGAAAPGAAAPGPAAYGATAGPPAVRLQRRSFARTNWTILAAALLLVVGVIGGGLWCTRPVRLPEIGMNDGEGKPVTFADMRRGKDKLLLVFVIPGCEISRFSLTTIKGLFPGSSGRVAFAGLAFTTQAEAQSFQAEQEVPFPVYGLRDSRDPFALQDVLKKVGASGLAGASIYGGTVVLLDQNNRVLLRLEKEEIRQLPEKLGAASK
jgi:hypothetical protein